MKIDMNPEAIRGRFNQVRMLRRLCLSLARSSAGQEVIKRHGADERVRRTARALGR